MLVMLTWGSAWSLLHQAMSSQSKLASVAPRHVRRPLTAWALVRGTGGTSLALFTSDLPLHFMAATVLEYGLGLDGLGKVTIDALRAGDVAWLMAVSLLGALVIGLTQVVGDEVSRALGSDGASSTTRFSARAG
jgi:hypothetical protein